MTIQKFIDKYNGASNIGNTPENKGQCVGLVMVWIKNLGLPHIWGHAFSLLTNADPKFYKVIDNTPKAIPNPGDVIVWTKGFNDTFGHTAIVTKATVNTFEVFEQNNPLGFPCRLHTYKNYAYVSGWLHPKPAIIAQPIAQSVFNDQTIIPKELLAEDQDLEIQQIRGLLLDGKRDDLDLQNTKEELKNYKIANNEQAIMIRDLRNENDKQVLLISQLEKDLGTVTAFNTPKTADNLTVSQLLTALINKLFFDK